MRVLGIIVLLALGGVLAQGLVALARSEALQLEELEVTGNQRVGEQQIVEATGVEPGEPLLTVSTTRLVERIERIPWIRTARVERILPSKLRVLVVERTAELVVRTPAGPYLTDAEGLVLQQGDENLVEMVNLPVQELGVGMHIDHPAFRHARRAYESLWEPVRSRVVSISASSVDQVKFNLHGGLQIFFGAAEQIDEKNRAVDAMLGELAGTDPAASTIDVRVPSRPTLRSS